MLDQISLGIMWNRLISITDEFLSSLVRGAFSTIVRESYDLTCVLLDRRARVIAQGTYSGPSFTRTAPVTLRRLLEYFPPDTLKPGDVLATNDPWIGTGHLFDISVARPMFHRDRLIGYTFSITHLPDIGGTGFGAASKDVFQEGLRIPPWKIVSGGTVDRQFIELVRANVRVPDQTVGDIFANINCNKVGEERTLEFLNEYGLEDLDEIADQIIQVSEDAIRREIRGIPDGSYRHAMKVEGAGGTLTLRCCVDVAGDEIAISFDGTDGVVPSGINVPFCYTNAMALYAVKCLTTADIPNNEGAVAPITVEAPAGCVLNAPFPCATGARHVIGHYVVPLVFGALAQAMPERVQAESGMMNLVTVRGVRRDGSAFSSILFAAGGFGATTSSDGASTTPGPSNMAVTPVEVWEAETDTMIERKRLLPDSGGAGRKRGGLGQEIVLRNTTGAAVTIACMGQKTDFPAAGMAGGRPGLLRQFRIKGDAVDARGMFEVAPGEALTLIEAGGGGFGQPLERDREAVRRDLELGLISATAASDIYGLKGQ